MKIVTVLLSHTVTIPILYRHYLFFYIEQDSYVYPRIVAYFFLNRISILSRQY